MGRVRGWATLGGAAAVVLTFAAPAGAAPDVGAITGVDCVANSPDIAGCGTTLEGLEGVTSVAVSPDGKSVYAVSATDNAIVRFDRDATTGALTGVGCISDVGDPAGCGTTQEGLDRPEWVTVSPDGKSVYVAGAFDDAIVRFDRNTTTGALTPAGCVADVGGAIGCATTQQGLDGVTSITVSPDGKSVYAAGRIDDAIVRFDRNTTTGALNGAGCIADVGSAIGCGVTEPGLDSVQAITVSPDRKTVYAVASTDKAIVRFDRNTGNGSLTGAGCISDVGAPAGCSATQQGLDGAVAVIVSPDDESVYAASFTDSAVVRFSRNTTSGALTGAGCVSDVGSPAGCGATQQGLNQVVALATSLDGRSVYAASFGDEAIVRFDRNTASGELTGRGCISKVGDPANCGATQKGIGAASAVAVSPDGRSVYVIGSADGALARFGRLPDASNHSLIRIPSSQLSQPADPSPSTIIVSGLDARISDLDVTLEGLNHTSPEDLDILLEGPGGQRVLLASDAGGRTPGVSDIDLIFDDGAAGQVPAPPATGSFRPTNFDDGPADSFAAPYCNPGPGGVGPLSSCLARTFNGTNPNGTWNLYVVDDTTVEEGQLARGWSLAITTDVAAPQTTIDSGPSGTIIDASPSFRFSSSEAGSTFECSIDNGAFVPCASPQAYPALAIGPHNFAVRAIDPAGNIDATPATRLFAVAAPDVTVPDTKVDGSATAAKKQKQKGKKVAIAVAIDANEALKVDATGSIKAGKSIIALKPLSTNVSSDSTLVLKPSRSKDGKKAAAAGKGKAMVEVVLTDAAGNKTTAKLSIKLNF